MRHAVHNGVAASVLAGAQWQGSRHGSPGAAATELTRLPGGMVAMRNARDPDGPALIYTPAEIEAFLAGAKEGDFDRLIG